MFLFGKDNCLGLRGLSRFVNMGDGVLARTNSKLTPEIPSVNLDSNVSEVTVDPNSKAGLFVLSLRIGCLLAEI